MFDPAKPLILVLDPDEDFFEAASNEGKSRHVNLVSKIYAKQEQVNLEEVILAHYPDIIVLNLDQQDELSFGKPIEEIFQIPVPIPPIMLGVTNRDSISLKQKAYAMGIDDYMIRPFTPRELWWRLDVLLKTRRLQIQLDMASKRLSTTNIHLTNSNRFLEEMTATDELTGLNNMRYMTQYLERQFALFSRHNRPFSIMMIDLDHFKEVNDNNDHLVGSETIKHSGLLIQEATRGSDVKARYGGDEFIIAMPETEEVGAESVGERIRKSIEDTTFKGNDGKSFRISASIGSATFDKNRHKTYKDIVKDADYALYVAKEQGRNRVILFNEDLATKKDRGSNYDESQSGVLSEMKKIKA